MSDMNNNNDPLNPPRESMYDASGTSQQSTGQRLNDALETTGKRLSEEVNQAGERVRTFVEDKRINEQVEVVGGQVVERVKNLIEEGNVRRLILRNSEGRVLLEIPLTAGVAVGGAVLWLNPILASLGALAALVARVNIEIVREEPEATKHDIEQTAKDIQDRLGGE